MRKMIISTFLLLAWTQPAFALLPPFYESLSELTSLLKDPRLAEKLGSGEPILNIQKNNLGYLITSNKYQLQVNVIYQETKLLGPAQYTLEYENPVLLR